MLLVAALAGCGFKDVPLPQASYTAALLPPVSVTTHFRGARLRVFAQWAEGTTPEVVLLTAEEQDTSCGLCLPVTRFVLKIAQAAPPEPLAADAAESPPEQTQPQPRAALPPQVELLQGELSHRARLGEVLARFDKELELLFPPAFAGEALKGNLTLFLTPANRQGQTSIPSPGQKPKEPLPLAKPEITTQLLPGCQTCDPELPLRLQLTWKGAEPIEEGGLYRITGLGVNFYRRTPPKGSPALAQEGGIPLPEERLNPLPQYQGVFVVPHPQGTLLARAVDAFGNESEPVTLYEESPALYLEKN